VKRQTPRPVWGEASSPGDRAGCSPAGGNNRIICYPTRCLRRFGAKIFERACHQTLRAPVQILKDDSGAK